MSTPRPRPTPTPPTCAASPERSPPSPPASAARGSLGELQAALAHDDPADLITPLTATRSHLAAIHPDLAARIDSLT
ncbi:hypothetical protein [Streptomyces sp. NPDC004435]|uniref:hypothetical protein n=1 Tax=Streptomyces sp. NPDC004435 TaxID=3364701 RepID=UPI00368258A3